MSANQPAREGASVPREQYERDLIAAIREAARLRSELLAAHRRMTAANGFLTPGMKAGVAQAKTILNVGARKALEATSRPDDEKVVGDPEREKVPSTEDGGDA